MGSPHAQSIPMSINLRNNPITTYRYQMHQEDLARQFCRWYRMRHGNKKTVCLLGIRADESLQRYRGFLNQEMWLPRTTCWISSQFKNVWTRISHVRLDHQRCVARQCCVSL